MLMKYKDFKTMSKEDMKSVLGGTAPQSCSMTYQDSGGVWHTETGTCNTESFVSVGYHVVTDHFCQTASFQHPVALSSNGGTSRCGGREVM